MNKKSTNIILFLALFCASFISFSQENPENEEGLTLLEDSDDNLIKFENHYFEALKYKAIGNYTRAITELENCQQLFPNSASIEFEFAKNYYLLNQFDEAALYIEKSLKTDATNFWSLEQAKKIYLKQFNYDQAIEVQEKMVDLRPKLNEDLILLYIQGNERNKAEKFITELESKGITSTKIEQYKRILLSKAKVVEKKIEVKNNTLDALKKTYDNTKKFSILKEILTQESALNNFDSLLKYSQQGLELYPAQPYVYLMNGKALISLKKYTEAIDVLNNGIDYVIDDTQLEIHFHGQLAISYKATNQLKKAKESVKKTTSLRKKENQ